MSGRTIALTSLLLYGFSLACMAQPAGMIDPLYDHPCNTIVDRGLATASKADLAAKMIELDGPYRKSEELGAAGRTREALEQLLLYQQSIAQILAPTHHVALDARLRIASMRSQLRQYEQALQDMQAVLRIRESCLGANDGFTLEALSMIAQLQERMGQAVESLAASEELLRRSRARFESLPEAEKSTEEERKKLLVAQWNLAALQYRTRQFEAAKAGAERTVSLAATLPPADIERYELTNTAWYVIDRVAFRAGNVDAQKRAIVGLKESYLSMRERLGETHRRTLPALANLGFAVADVDPALAVAILGDYVAIVEGTRQQAALPNERQVLLEGRANAYLRFAFAAHDAKRAEEAFYGIEWSKSRALRDDLALKSAIRDSLLTPEERAALDGVQSRMVQLQGFLDETNLPVDRRQAAERALLQATQDYESKLQAAQARNPRIRIAAQAQIEPPGNAKALLKSDEVFINYLVRRVDGPVFEILIAVLEPDGQLTLAGPVAAPGLEQTIASWTRILSTRGGLAAVAARGQVELFQVGEAFFFDGAEESHQGAKKIFSSAPVREVLSNKLMPPEVRAITSKYQRWIISPGGMLWSVPFEALNDAEGLVLDTRIVRYVHSWTMFTVLNQTTKPIINTTRTPLIAIGDAKYSDVIASPEDGAAQPENGWSDLAFSKDELDRAERLYSLVAGKTLFRGPQALRSTVLALNESGALSQTDVLLLSAHGYLDRARPELSAIVLGRPEKGTEADRYLRARDIARLKLNTNLVIVSSCDSASGRIASGEGVLGLPYAFFAAGASGAVLTLWEVNDDGATVSLVDQLLKGMKGGAAADEALTHAKRAIRAVAAEDSWAPFSLLSR
ncbi:CHAT domain-containing protein [Steroidobacter cummioxidans]|uniref:CHAT domain-containing protein n=1 Tax=Steroidobacter cummioxidans TaxID=1803913 RepID=UPI0013798458|nr:CHAT domain-containing tetratricopeptide repeat protein [Steroidobacter cummioxidans]